MSNVCKNLSKLYLFFLSILGVLIFCSCNMTGGIDKPETTEEKLAGGKAHLDGDECDQGLSEIDKAGDNTEKARLQGISYLCKAGAPFKAIEKSLFTYDSSLNDLTIIGKLANEMIPMNETKVTYIDQAIAAFTSMDANVARTDRSLLIAIANMAKAAGIIAEFSRDYKKVYRSDLSTGCVGVTCSAATSVNCPPAYTFNDTTANRIGQALINANSEIGSNSDLTNLRSLAAALGSNASSTTGPINRCLAVNSMISANP